MTETFMIQINIVLYLERKVGIIMILEKDKEKFL